MRRKHRKVHFFLWLVMMLAFLGASILIYKLFPAETTPVNEIQIDKDFYTE